MMARSKDGRMGLSINPATVEILDKVIDMLRETTGMRASYTQAVQFVAYQYMLNQREPLDNVTDSHSVPTQGEENEIV